VTEHLSQDSYFQQSAQTHNNGIGASAPFLYRRIILVDVVSTNTLFNGQRRLALQLLNASDGTGETLVVKAASASYTGPNPPDATTHFVIEEITWDVQGFTHVDLYFEETTDIPAAKLSGQGYKDYREVGGLVDPTNTGTTGDILLSTVGGNATSTYDITLSLRKKN
jgi:hypothetical protein